MGNRTGSRARPPHTDPTVKAAKCHMRRCNNPVESERWMCRAHHALWVKAGSPEGKAFEAWWRDSPDVEPVPRTPPNNQGALNTSPRRHARRDEPTWVEVQLWVCDLRHNLDRLLVIDSQPMGLPIFTEPQHDAAEALLEQLRDWPPTLDERYELVQQSRKTHKEGTDHA